MISFRGAIVLIMLVLIAGPLAEAQADATPPPTQVAPTTAPTQAAELSPTPLADTTDTNGIFIAGLIVWGVIIVLVAVTAFLVWRTRPKR
jgi:hypothetical protein